MKLKINLINLSILIVSFSFQTVAQVNDFGLWTGILIKSKISKGLQASFEEEFRFSENVSALNEFYSDVGLSYKINKYFDWGIYYRYAKEQNSRFYFSNCNSFYTDLSFSHKIDRISFDYRTRYQSKYVDIYSRENGLIPRNYNRNKLSLEYNIKNSSISPFLFCELFLRLNNNIGYSGLTKIRYTAGITYKINKSNKVDIYYMLQKELNENNPLNSYILGITYSCSVTTIKKNDTK